jgi:Gpi18-like mannosyltransferase
MANVETAAGSVQAGETSLLDFSFRLPAIGLVLAGGLVLRLIVATLPGFGVDIGLFQFWSEQLAQHGPWDFYDTDFFTDYAPGYMYVLLLIGKLDQAFHFSNETFEYVLKLPAIAADLGSAYVLYKLLDGQRMETRLGAAALWLVFPATLLIGPIWGQVDSLLAFFLLLSIYYIGRDRPVRGAVAFTLGFLVKPQAIAALPFLAIWIMRRNPPAWSSSGASGALIPDLWIRITGICLGLVLVLILPFFTYEPWKFIEHLYNATNVPNYRVNSFWAYNFWNIQGIFESGFKPDNQEFAGITHRAWGIILFVLSLVGIIAATWRAKGTGMLALGVALSMMVFYLFLTRMHERYVFPAMLPMLAACVLLNSRLLWGAFLAFATLHFINLYHVYIYDLYNDDNTTPDIIEESPLKVDTFYRWLESSSFLGTSYDTVQVFSFLMVLLFPIALALAYALSRRPAAKPHST